MFKFAFINNKPSEKKHINIFTYFGNVIYITSKEHLSAKVTRRSTCEKNIFVSIKIFSTFMSFNFLFV